MSTPAVKLDIAANTIPIPIVPFPPSSGISFKGNTLTVTVKDLPQKYKRFKGLFINDVYQTYNHLGKYVASCSSYFNDGTDQFQPYHAFNPGSISGWISAIQDGNDNISIYYDANNTTENNKTKYTKLHNGASYYNSNTVTNIRKPNVPFSIAGSSDYNIKGEWLQIDLPADKPFYLFRYKISVPPPVYSVNYKNGYYPTDPKYAPNYIPNYAKKPLADYKPHYLDTNVYTNTITPNISVDNNNVSTYDYNNLISNHIPSKYTSHFPKVFAVVGSNDGKNWFYIDQQSFVDPPDLPLNKPNIMKGNAPNFKQGYEIDYESNTLSFEVNVIDRYCKYRLIVSELFPGNAYAEISTFSLYAFVNNVNSNGLSQFSDVPYHYGEIDRKENFTTNSQDNLTDLNMSHSLQYESVEIIDNKNKDLDKLYKDQLSSFNKAKIEKNSLPNLDSYVFIKDIKTSSGKEGFDTNNFNNYGYNENAIPEKQFTIDNKINPMAQMYGDYIQATNDINHNYFILKGKITDFSNNYFPALNDPTDPLDLGKAGFNKQPTLVDGWVTDNREMVLNQNSMFIMTTIAVGTMVLGLLMTWK